MKTLFVALATCTAFATPLFAAGTPGAHFIDNWDLSGDGIVDMADLTERRGDIFTTFDANEDGYLDAAEYVEFDAARAADMAENADGHGKGGGMNKIQQALQLGFNDADADGKVSRAEFIDATGAMMTLADKSGDGVISAADFGKK